MSKNALWRDQPRQAQKRVRRPRKMQKCAKGAPQGQKMCHEEPAGSPQGRKCATGAPQTFAMGAQQGPKMQHGDPAGRKNAPWGPRRPTRLGPALINLPPKPLRARDYRHTGSGGGGSINTRWSLYPYVVIATSLILISAVG